MNSYGQKVKCQNQNDGGHKPKKSNAGMMRVNKKTNTPSEFLICEQCQQFAGAKLNNNAMTIGDCGVGIGQYTKALNYINSCHSIINKMINRFQTDSDSQILSMPDLPNFIDLFSSIHNTKQNLTPREMNAEKPHDQPESPKSDEEMCESMDDSDDKAERQSLEDPDQKYLFSEVKQNGELKTASQDHNYSAPTTENEDSEVELDLSQPQSLTTPNKFKPVTLQSQREQVIYEEMNSHEEYPHCNLPSKQNKEEPCPKQNNAQEFSSVRSKKSSNIPGRIKSPLPNTPRPREVNHLTASTNTTQRKIKPRSASAKPINNYASPEEKKRNCVELNGNYSDTAISIKNSTKMNNRVNEKSLAHPIGLGPNSALSQRELDKYAKELLGSGSISPRSNSPDARNVSPKQPVRQKTDERSKMHAPKTAGSSRNKQVDVKKRPGSHQERQTIPSKCQPVQTQTVVMQQNGPKKYNNCFAAVPFHKTMAESQQTDDQLLRNATKHHNLSATRSQNLQSSTVTKLQSSTRTNLNVSPTTDEAQQKYRRVKTRGPLTHTEPNSDGAPKSPSKIQETQQNILQTNHQMIMNRRMCPSATVNNNNSEAKSQFSVTIKPHDFFTVNRKTSSHHQRKSVAKQNCRYTNVEVNAAESDDIKTDSDIEEDQFNNDEEDKKSTSSVRIKKVLSNLGLFPNGQTNPETEHLKMEAKSTRANDERNRPFREPRKSNPEPEIPEMIRLRISDDGQHDVYEGASVTNLGRTQSEESSDIKSDNEDDYLRVRTVSYNCYSANRYHRT